MLGDQQHLKNSKARVVHPDVYILPSKEDPIYHLLGLFQPILYELREISQI